MIAEIEGNKLEIDFGRAGRKRVMDASSRCIERPRATFGERLNIIDCFAYPLAMEHRCPLLFVGNDFAQTDVRIAG